MTKHCAVEVDVRNLSELTMSVRNSITTRTRISFLGGVALAALALFVGLLKTAGEGYLSRVGPAPIRYQPPAVASFVLPPLPSQNPTSAVPEQLPEPAESFTMVPSQSPPEIPPQLSAPPGLWLDRVTQTNAFESMLPSPIVSSATSVVTVTPASNLLPAGPEVLIDYLRFVNGATNAAGASVLVPLQFTPAMPEEHSSSATYRTP
jgi:hypothetical protein